WHRHYRSVPWLTCMIGSSMVLKERRAGASTRRPFEVPALMNALFSRGHRNGAFICIQFDGVAIRMGEFAVAVANQVTIVNHGIQRGRACSLLELVQFHLGPHGLERRVGGVVARGLG